ncbi:MAG: hypothetical protein IT381_00080 [Deltaproteobacteria bacterium]|nr:hypothetical protein [Deltaproteobacteria bacterium]
MTLRLSFSLFLTLVLLVLGLDQLRSSGALTEEAFDVGALASVIVVAAVCILLLVDSVLSFASRRAHAAFAWLRGRRSEKPRAVPATLLCLALLFSAPTRAHAGASILGFSVGDDTMTLGAILTEIIHQVKILNDVATMTRVMRDNIAFMKDVIETGNDLVNGRWEVLTEQFLMTIVNSDENLREIYRNTSQIVTNRVPRSNMFRKLMMAGFEHVVFEAFGPYPFGRISTGSAYMDVSAMRLNDLAREQMRDWKNEHRRIEQAIRECQKTSSFEVCNSAANRMEIQSALHLEQLKAIEAERAQTEAAKIAVENGERKQRQLATQKDVTDVVEAAASIVGVYSAGMGAFP